MAPLHLTSSHGRPEHISTSPPIVAVPVVDSVEKLPGDWASASAVANAPRKTAITATMAIAPLPHCGRGRGPRPQWLDGAWEGEGLAKGSWVRPSPASALRVPAPAPGS